MWASSEAAAADVSVGDDGVPTPDHGTPLAAHALAWWLPQPCDLALVGAAAFASGVTRAVSTVVIVFELASGDTAGRVALPLGVACLAAVFVGEALGTLRDALIGTNARRGCRPAALPSLIARDVMDPVQRPRRPDPLAKPPPPSPADAAATDDEAAAIATATGRRAPEDERRRAVTAATRGFASARGDQRAQRAQGGEHVSAHAHRRAHSDGGRARGRRHRVGDDGVGRAFGAAAWRDGRGA